MSGCGWSIRQGMYAYLLLIFVGGIGSLGVFVVVSDPSEALNVENPAVLMTMIGATVLGMAAALMYAARIAGRDAFQWGSMSVEWTCAAVALTVPVLAFGFGWSQLIEWMGIEALPQTFVQGLLDTPSMAALLVAGGYGVFGAAILEEMLFRGFIQPPMVARFGAAGGIVMASAVFGLVHISDPRAVIPTAVIGGVAGWLRHRTGGLGASIVFHAVNNLLAFMLTAAAT